MFGKFSHKLYITIVINKIVLVNSAIYFMLVRRRQFVLTSSNKIYAHGSSWIPYRFVDFLLISRPLVFARFETWHVEFSWCEIRVRNKGSVGKLPSCTWGCLGISPKASHFRLANTRSCRLRRSAIWFRKRSTFRELTAKEVASSFFRFTAACLSAPVLLTFPEVSCTAPESSEQSRRKEHDTRIKVLISRGLSQLNVILLWDHFKRGRHQSMRFAYCARLANRWGVFRVMLPKWLTFTCSVAKNLTFERLLRATAPSHFFFISLPFNDLRNRFSFVSQSLSCFRVGRIVSQEIDRPRNKWQCEKDQTNGK